MIMKTILTVCAFLLVAIPQAYSAGDAPKVEKQDWHFSGPFGTFDRGALQRGFRSIRKYARPVTR